MAINLKAKIDKAQTISLVSIHDDAIDWSQTFPGIEPEEKRKAFKECLDLGQICFAGTPTLFVFAHPRRVDIATEMRKVYSAIYSNNGDLKNRPDLLSEIWHIAFRGTREGEKGEQKAAPRVDGKIAQDFMQGLEDADVMDELALKFLAAYKRSEGDAAAEVGANAKK